MSYRGIKTFSVTAEDVPFVIKDLIKYSPGFEIHLRLEGISLSRYVVSVSGDCGYNLSEEQEDKINRLIIKYDAKLIW